MTDRNTPEASAEEVDPILALAAALGDDVVDEINADLEEQHEEDMARFANAKEVHVEAKQKEEWAKFMNDWLEGIGENLNFDDLDNPHEWLNTAVDIYEEQGVTFSAATKGLLEELGSTYEGLEALITDTVLKTGADKEKVTAKIMGNEKLQAKLKEKFTPILERMKEEVGGFHQGAKGEEEDAYSKTQGFNESLQLVQKGGTPIPEIAEANIDTLREIFRKKIEQDMFGKDCEEALRKLNYTLNQHAGRFVKGKTGWMDEDEKEKAMVLAREEYLKREDGKEEMADIKQQELLRDVAGPYIVDTMVKNMEAYVRETNPDDADKAVAEFFSQKDLLKEFARNPHHMREGFEIDDKISISYKAKKDSDDPDSHLYYVVMNGERSEPKDLKKDDVFFAKELEKAKALLKLPLATDLQKKGRFEIILEDYYVLAMVFNKFDELMKMDRKVVCDREDRLFKRDDDFDSRVRDNQGLQTDVYADYLKRLPSVDPQFLGLIQALYNFTLQTSKVKEDGKDYGYERKEASMTRIFNTIFGKRTRDGIGYDKAHKDDILESHEKTVQGLRKFEKKAGKKPKAILSVEDARGVVDQLNVEYARRVDGIMSELETLRKEKEKQEEAMQRAIDRLGIDADGDKQSLQKSIADLQRKAERSQESNERYEKQVAQLTESLEEANKANQGTQEMMSGNESQVRLLLQKVQALIDAEGKKGALTRKISGAVALNKIKALIIEAQEGRLKEDEREPEA